MRTRITALLMALLLCIAFTSCSSKNNSDPISATKSATKFEYLSVDGNKPIDLGKTTLEQSIDMALESIVDTYTTRWELEEVDALAGTYDVKLFIEASNIGLDFSNEIDFLYTAGHIVLYYAKENGKRVSVEDVVEAFWPEALI